MADRSSAALDHSNLSTPQTDDAVLVRRARADSAAFEDVYRKYVDAIYRYCYRRLGTPEHASDATSQIFIKALTGIDTCRETSFRSWLFTIARNVTIDEYRNNKPADSLDDVAEFESASATPEEVFVRNESRLEIIELLQHLTPDQRSVVELRLAGLNGNEIADVLGRSRASVDTAQSRAVARLRNVIGTDASALKNEEVANASA